MNIIPAGILNPGFLKTITDKFSPSDKDIIQEKSQKTFDPIDAADRFLNLSSSDKMDLLYNYSEIDKKDFEKFAKIIRNLIRHGVVGYEYLDYKKSPYKSFITTRIGDTRLYNKKLYRKKTYPYA
ncbi:hypothetical protein ACFL6G_03955 [candidate division KSB1 bacterium]